VSKSADQESPVTASSDSAHVNRARVFHAVSRGELGTLQETARRVRRHIVQMIGKAGSGHPGGSLSAVEVLVALYFQVMRHRPQEPRWPDRDRFVLSKGHAAPALYTVLAEVGYFPTEELYTLRQLGSRLQGHADMTKTPGVEMSAGSVGMGLSFGIGTALAARLDGKDYRTYVMLGDGECDEGQIWEAAMAASHFKVDNITAIVDRNDIQLTAHTDKIMSLEPLADKWRAFGWHTIEIDGHDLFAVLSALAEAKGVKDKPSVIISQTVKGKGVSFMEHNPGYHGKAPSPEQVEQALEEIG